MFDRLPLVSLLFCFGQTAAWLRRWTRCRCQWPCSLSLIAVNQPAGFHVEVREYCPVIECYAYS